MGQSSSVVLRRSEVGLLVRPRSRGGTQTRSTPSILSTNSESISERTAFFPARRQVVLARTIRIFSWPMVSTIPYSWPPRPSKVGPCASIWRRTAEHRDESGLVECCRAWATAQIPFPIREVARKVPDDGQRRRPGRLFSVEKQQDADSAPRPSPQRRPTAFDLSPDSRASIPTQ